MGEHRLARVGAVLVALAGTGACGGAQPSQMDAQIADAPSDAEPRILLDVRQVSGGGNCMDPAHLDAEPPAIFEVTACRHTTLKGGRVLAVFTWRNRTGQEQAAAYGPANHVSPGPDAQGQPSRFPVAGGNRFAVPFDGSWVAWTILGQTVAVSPDTPDCGDSCDSYGLAGPDSYPVDLCPDACGDGVCNYGEWCDSCPADCDCSSLYPLVDCVIPLPDGNKLVSFGYDNRAATGAALNIGPENRFLSGEPWRSQPVLFKAGAHHSVFQVTHGGDDVTWMLAGTAVTVSPDTPLCSQNCVSSCPRGSTCVADRCQGSCGDGLCIEGCDYCPDDCTCAAGNVCVGGGCYNPPYCGHDGIGLECGVSETCGVRVDCGPCPDGQACNSMHFCEPICAVGASP